MAVKSATEKLTAEMAKMKRAVVSSKFEGMMKIMRVVVGGEKERLRTMMRKQY
jgi:hypothetical protein